MGSLSHLDRRPVIAGVGQVANKDEERVVHPVVLLEDAARMALDDAGIAAGKIEAIFATPLSALVETDPAGMLAERLGVGPGPRCVSSYSGAAPQVLLAEACRAVRDGGATAALVVGGIADASVRRAHGRGADPPAPPGSLWSLGSDRPSGLARRRLPELEQVPEVRCGAGMPASYFALVQSALGRGRPLAAERESLGRLMAPFTQVAATRPSLAWFPEPRVPSEIAEPGPANRLIAEPYTKLMCSFPTVDLAAAVVVTADGHLSTPAVRPLALTNAKEASPPSGWQEMYRPLTLGRAVEMAFGLSGTTPDEAVLFDLYSCFPAAVLLGVDSIGLDPEDPRPFTSTGGLPYFGGPGASYSLHGVVCLVEELRLRSEGTAVALGIGGMVTDFSVGVYGLEDTPFQSGTVPKPDRPAVPVTPTGRGVATVEAMTVLHGRERGPVEAPIIARLPDGSRVGARCGDREQLAELAGTTLVGGEVMLEPVDGKVFYRPR